MGFGLFFFSGGRRGATGTDFFFFKLISTNLCHINASYCYITAKSHAIYCANSVETFSIIFHSPYAVKGYYLQEFGLINVS